jgi:Leucine-rich repeat (LRR) protein
MPQVRQYQFYQGFSHGGVKMKKVICFVLILVVLSSVDSFAEEPVYFPDANLKAAVEAALGKANPTPTDMLGLTSLIANSKGITNLTGLEYATNLTVLSLCYNHSITDISPLAGLTSLTALYLDINQITYISPLAGLTNLTYLDLSHNQITDISPLAGLTSLTALSLGSNSITDISPLAGLTSLENVHLPFNSITDISPLAGLTSLRDLNLGFNSITDISPLAGLTSLTSLQLWNNTITEISPLAGLISLTSLILSNNTITDISPVAGLTSLTYLYLYDNQITDISPLAGLTSLTNLLLSGNQITDISPLAGLTSLTHLQLYDNQISDISPLAGMTNLCGLYLYNNPLNCPAYDIYIPMIEANNPGIYLTYDPRPPECLNKPPVANAGQDVNTPILFELNLDGSGSYDPDGDYPLVYCWQILSNPQGSTAELSNPDSFNPSFVPDLVGEYVIELVVTDSRGLESEPDYVVITAITIEQAVDEKLAETIEQIGELDPNNLNNPNSANALINKIEAVLAQLDEGLYQNLLDKLQNDILKKTNGCAETGQPDKNDWILTCEDQQKVYPLVLRAIELLERLVQ